MQIFISWIEYSTGWVGENELLVGLFLRSDCMTKIKVNGTNEADMFDGAAAEVNAVSSY